MVPKGSLIKCVWGRSVFAFTLFYVSITVILHCMFTPPSGATLELSQTLFEIVEGDLAMRTTHSVCVILANDQSGLERDIVLNVETVTDNATSKFDNSIRFHHKLLCYLQGYIVESLCSGHHWGTKLLSFIEGWPYLRDSAGAFGTQQ